MTGKVSGAKGTVSDTLSTVVEKTRGAVQDGMERTRAAVSGSVSTMLDSRVVQLVSSGVDTALTTSESLVEQYLPLSEEELGEWKLLGKCLESNIQSPLLFYVLSHCNQKPPSYWDFMWWTSMYSSYEREIKMQCD